MSFTINFDFALFLRKAEHLLSPETIEEIGLALEKQQTTQGCFVDKEGKPDLYYTLFGVWLAKALDKEALLQKLDTTKLLDKPEEDFVHVCCQILIASIVKKEIPKPITHAFQNLSKENSSLESNQYNWFLKLLCLLALKSYGKLVRHYFKQIPSNSKTSSHLAIKLLFARQSQKTEVINDIYKLYYQGGFKAFEKSPQPDLLSTAVLVFALTSTNIDLRVVAPDILTFTNSLYLNGMYLSCVSDNHPDLEYTFYGLLTLAAIDKQINC